jgi:hypothetical protein
MMFYIVSLIALLNGFVKKGMLAFALIQFSLCTMRQALGRNNALI